MPNSAALGRNEDDRMRQDCWQKRDKQTADCVIHAEV